MICNTFSYNTLQFFRAAEILTLWRIVSLGSRRIFSDLSPSSLRRGAALGLALRATWESFLSEQRVQSQEASQTVCLAVFSMQMTAWASRAETLKAGAMDARPTFEDRDIDAHYPAFCPARLHHHPLRTGTASNVGIAQSQSLSHAS